MEKQGTEVSSRARTLKPHSKLSSSGRLAVIVDDIKKQRRENSRENFQDGGLQPETLYIKFGNLLGK